MAGDMLEIEAAAGENHPGSAPPVPADALVRCRDRFAAAIDRFETAIAARDVPLLSNGIA